MWEPNIPAVLIGLFFMYYGISNLWQKYREENPKPKKQKEK